jgi:hypothetical protein
MGQEICQEIHLFVMLEYHMFYILYPFETYLLTIPHIKMDVKE